MWPVLAGILGAAITAGVTAYLGRRAKTGNINTSEAKDLWDTLRAELGRLQTETTDLRAEIAVARIEMTALRDEAISVRVRIADLEAQLIACSVQEKLLRAKLRKAGVGE